MNQSRDESSINDFEEALKRLVANPRAKITKNRVANEAGRSHALLNRKSYANIREQIEKAEAKRKKELETQSLEEKILRLEDQLKSAKNKIKALQEQLASTPDYQAQIDALFVRLNEIYRYNDLLRSQLNQKHGVDITP